MHSKEPWKVHHLEDGSWVITAKVDGQDARIAECYPSDWSETPANAHLMGAAPELLKACKLMRDHIAKLANDSDFCWRDWPEAYEVDAAITKAKGK